MGGGGHALDSQSPSWAQPGQSSSGVSSVPLRAMPSTGAPSPHGPDGASGTMPDDLLQPVFSRKASVPVLQRPPPGVSGNGPHGFQETTPRGFGSSMPRGLTQQQSPLRRTLSAASMKKERSASVRRLLAAEPMSGIAAPAPVLGGQAGTGGPPGAGRSSSSAAVARQRSTSTVLGGFSGALPQPVGASELGSGARKKHSFIGRMAGEALQIEAGIAERLRERIRSRLAGACGAGDHVPQPAAASSGARRNSRGTATASNRWCSSTSTRHSPPPRRPSTSPSQLGLQGSGGSCGSGAGAPPPAFGSPPPSSSGTGGGRSLPPAPGSSQQAAPVPVLSSQTRVLPPAPASGLQMASLPAAPPAATRGTSPALSASKHRSGEALRSLSPAPPRSSLGRLHDSSGAGPSRGSTTMPANSREGGSQSSAGRVSSAAALPPPPTFGDEALQMSSELFEEVISRDEQFGETLRSVKTVYDAYLRQALLTSNSTGGLSGGWSGAPPPPTAASHGRPSSPAGAATPTPPLASWGTPPAGERRVAPGSPLEPNSATGNGPGALVAAAAAAAAAGASGTGAFNEQGATSGSAERSSRQSIAFTEMERENRELRKANQRLQRDLDLAMARASVARKQSSSSLQEAASPEAIGLRGGARPSIASGRGSGARAGSPSAMSGDARARLPRAHSREGGSQSSASPARRGAYTPPKTHGSSRNLLSTSTSQQPLASQSGSWAFSDAHREPDLIGSPSPLKGGTSSAARVRKAVPAQRALPEPPDQISSDLRSTSSRAKLSIRSSQHGTPKMEERPTQWNNRFESWAGAMDGHSSATAQGRHTASLDGSRASIPADPEADSGTEGASGGSVDEALPQRQSFGHGRRPSSVPRLNLVSLSAKAGASEESDEEGDDEDEDESVGLDDAGGHFTSAAGRMSAPQGAGIVPPSESSTASTRGASTPPFVATNTPTPPRAAPSRSPAATPPFGHSMNGAMDPLTPNSVHACLTKQFR